MNEHWDGSSNPRRDIGATPHGRGSSSSEPSSLPTLTDGERKPSKAVEACILELALRFPCPRDTDPDRYAARLNLLTRDCAGLNPALLRKACDRAAQTAKGLPYASEILAAAAEIVAERQQAQAAQAREAGQPCESDRERAMRAHNLKLQADGRPFRYHGNWQAVSILKPSPAVHADAICNADGTVSLAEFEAGQWVYRRTVGQ